MKLDELNEIFYINKEIEQLYKELANLKQQSFVKPISISDMPKGGGNTDLMTEYVSEKLEIENMINYALIKLQRERKKVEKFLMTVENAELRLIIRLRCINNMKWGEIANEIGYERTTVSKKFYDYFKGKHNSHNSH